MNIRVEIYEEVSSTNDIVKERIDLGEPEGLAVRAQSQNGGYGRRGNSWTSPKGGLYMSILLRPKVDIENLPTLPHVCAIAARRAITRFLGSREAASVKIKWPNDIVYMEADDVPCSIPANKDNGTVDARSETEMSPRTASLSPFKKICGISVERHKGAICVGIGINVRRPETHEGGSHALSSSDGMRLSSSTRNVPFYLNDLMLDGSSIEVDELANALLKEICCAYSEWTVSLFEGMRGEYMDNFALEGFKVRIDECSNRPMKCRVIGIDGKGNLEVVPLGESEIKTISSGTVRMLR